MKRLRYNKITDNLLATDYLLAGKLFIKIILNLSELTVIIIDKDSNELFKDKAISQQMLKIKAKKTAKTLGIKFEDEVRPKL